MNVRSRHRARERALQVLYRADISECAPDENNFRGDDGGATRDEAAIEYARTLVDGVFGKMKEIDGLIESSSEHWRVKRMPVVDRNVLRIAVYELRYTTDVPFKVVIDEAVELAKKFGSDRSGAFVNGVLDRVHKEALEGKAAGTA